MIDFLQLFETNTGKILLSIIWGLGLASLFKKACTLRKCKVIQYKGPNPEEIQQYYYKYGSDNCYKYTPYLVEC